MKLKLYLLLPSLVLTSISARSQEVAKPLTIGNSMPDITIQHILNYKKDSARISEFKGKVLILDFFATWCGSCIGGLQRLDTLQNKFSKDLQILVVSAEKPKIIESLLKHNPNVKGVSLPFVVSDSILGKLFPHKLIPHEVWIDKLGKVAAITESSYVNAANIGVLVKNGKLNLPLKEEVADFDLHKPLLENGNGGTLDKLISRTTMTRFLPSVGSIKGHISDSILQRIYYTNFSILGLYQIALHFPNNRIILDVKNPDVFLNRTDMDSWEANNFVSYDITVPHNTSKGKIDSMMVNDLNRNLNLYGRMETRKVKCWVLKKTSETKDLLKTKGGQRSSAPDFKKHLRMIINQSMSNLIFVLNFSRTAAFNKPIIIDGTHIKYNVDTALPLILPRNISELRSILKSYGLKLEERNKKLRMFVLSDRNCH